MFVYQLEPENGRFVAAKRGFGRSRASLVVTNVRFVTACDTEDLESTMITADSCRSCTPVIFKQIPKSWHLTGLEAELILFTIQALNN